MPDESSPSAAQAPKASGSPPLNSLSTSAVTRDESAKLVITEDDVRGLERGALDHRSIRTKSAAMARAVPAGFDVVPVDTTAEVRAHRRHCDVLAGLGHRVNDFGTNSESAVDYPDFAHAVARAVADHTVDVGIVIDGAGVGSAMTANKVPGVRAAACYSVEVARNSREHNGANVLTLGSKTISNDQMREIVRAWLTTDLTEDRHRKRVGKIEAIERQYQR